MSINEKQFNRVFNICLIVGMAMLTLIVTAWRATASESGRGLLLLTAFGSLMGICSTVSSANGKIWTFIFGFFDVSIYAFMCFMGAKYGNAVLHALYFVPMQFVGWYQWSRSGSSDADRVKARRLDSRQRILFPLLFMAGSVLSYIVLARFDKDSADTFIKMAVILDVIPMMCNIIGQLLMSMAYMEQWIFWLGVNVFSILMWLTTFTQTHDSYSLIYVVKYSFYLVNAVNGLRIWIGLSRPEPACQLK